MANLTPEAAKWPLDDTLDANLSAVGHPYYDDDEPDLDLAIFGANLRRLRTIRGYSTRQLAREAGIAKATLLRAEQGLPTRKAVRNKLCAALAVRLADLTVPLPTSELNVHRAEGEFWQMVRGDRPSPFHYSHERLRDPAERARLARLGWASRFTNIFRASPSKGQLTACELEIYGADPEPVSHPGEEFIFILSGRITIKVRDQEIIMNAGDSLTFDSSDPHSYAADPNTAPPARALVVVRQGSYGRPSRRSASKTKPPIE